MPSLSFLREPILESVTLSPFAIPSNELMGVTLSDTSEIFLT